LSTISVNNSIHAPEIEKLASAICDGDDDPALMLYAVEIAESEMILNLVAAERVAAIERLRDPTQLALCRQGGAVLHAYHWRKEARLAYYEYKHRAPGVMKKIKASAAGEPVTFAEVPDFDWRQVAIEERDEFDALQAAMSDIEKLARYERRAWSRYRRAVRGLTELKAAKRQEAETGHATGERAAPAKS